jgi:hypothetical protein
LQSREAFFISQRTARAIIAGAPAEQGDSDPIQYRFFDISYIKRDNCHSSRNFFKNLLDKLKNYCNFAIRMKHT